MDAVTQTQKWSLSKAVILTIAVFFACSVGDVLSKFLQGKFDAIQILAVGQGTALLIVMAYAARQRGWKNIFASNYWPLHALRALFSLFSASALFYVLRHIPLSDFYGIVFAGPLCVTAMSALILKEKVHITRWTAVIVGFIGVMVIVGSSFSHFNMGYAVAMLMPLFYSGSVLAARRIGSDEHPTMFALPALLALTFVYLPMLPKHYVAPDLGEWALFALYAGAVVAGAIGLGTCFARTPSVSTTAPMHYTQIIWGTLAGWMLFDATLSTSTFVGSAIVIASGLVVLWREKVRHIPHGVPPPD